MDKSNSRVSVALATALAPNGAGYYLYGECGVSARRQA